MEVQLSNNFRDLRIHAFLRFRVRRATVSANAREGDRKRDVLRSVGNASYCKVPRTTSQARVNVDGALQDSNFRRYASCEVTSQVPSNEGGDSDLANLYQLVR